MSRISPRRLAATAAVLSAALVGPVVTAAPASAGPECLVPGVCSIDYSLPSVTPATTDYSRTIGSAGANSGALNYTQEVGRSTEINAEGGFSVGSDDLGQLEAKVGFTQTATYLTGMGCSNSLKPGKKGRLNVYPQYETWVFPVVNLQGNVTDSVTVRKPTGIWCSWTPRENWTSESGAGS